MTTDFVVEENKVRAAEIDIHNALSMLDEVEPHGFDAMFLALSRYGDAKFMLGYKAGKSE
jgi:hypothetical protein